MIPNLYETENIPVDEKIIHCVYSVMCQSYWLVAEVDPVERRAFGWALLNLDFQMAEWGYMDLDELESVNVVKLPSWKPCKFKEALEILKTNEFFGEGRIHGIS